MELFLLCCSLKKQKAKKDLDVVEEWVTLFQWVKTVHSFIRTASVLSWNIVENK